MKTKLEDLQEARDSGNEAAQEKIDDYFFSKELPGRRRYEKKKYGKGRTSKRKRGIV